MLDRRERDGRKDLEIVRHDEAERRPSGQLLDRNGRGGADLAEREILDHARTLEVMQDAAGRDQQGEWRNPSLNRTDARTVRHANRSCERARFQPGRKRDVAVSADVDAAVRSRAIGVVVERLLGHEPVVADFLLRVLGEVDVQAARADVGFLHLGDERVAGRGKHALVGAAVKGGDERTRDAVAADGPAAEDAVPREQEGVGVARVTVGGIEDPAEFHAPVVGDGHVDADRVAGAPADEVVADDHQAAVHRNRRAVGVPLGDGGIPGVHHVADDVRAAVEEVSRAGRRLIRAVALTETESRTTQQSAVLLDRGR